MKILNYTRSLEEDYCNHIIIFEVDNKKFLAYVFENAIITDVEFCFDIKEKKEVDIPKYFRSGVSSKVYDLLYTTIDEQFGGQF